MANKFCTSCGAPMEGKKFCTECGSPAESGGAQEPVVEQVVQPVVEPAVEPVVQPVPMPSDEKPVGRYAPIGTPGWIGIFLLMLIPVVNLVLLIVWACGGCQKVTKRSFARATLIFLVISIILGAAIGYFAKRAINGWMQESGITRQIGDIPGGRDIAPEALPPGDGLEAFGILFPDGQFDEQTLYEMGCSQEEIELLRAVMENDRQALLDMGYSEEEVDEVLNLFR